MNLFNIIISFLVLIQFSNTFYKREVHDISNLYTKIELNTNELDKYELEVKNGDRFFISDIQPNSDAERVILDSFKVQITDEYDKFNDLLVPGDLYNKEYPEVYKNNLKLGMYTEEIKIHELRKLGDNEYKDEKKGVMYYKNIEKLDELNIDDFEIIEVKYNIKLTGSYNKTAQRGSGEWIRYYVVVQIDEIWKIYEIYGHS